MEIIGVRFKKKGKIYYFNPCGQKIAANTPIIVETIRGVEYGKVVLSNRNVDNIEIPVKNIIRVATPEDTRQEEENCQREREAVDLFLTEIKHHGLDMHLIDVEITFDFTKIIFYFTAEGRIDFRELVKSLAIIFRMRIELRQIGVRDEAKILNSIGICGRTLCCATFLDDFQPVSIKMAKDQGLSLNPTKISGACGRLMCCLKYEEETYDYLSKKLPHIGETVTTLNGSGEVVSVNVLCQTVKVATKLPKQDVFTIEEYPVAEIKAAGKKKCAKECEKCAK
ncbi:MAG: stage 0 sporulation family protein [Defluviitaleaceae bacterium]|nr:stage 0 sporulation family protein [Defluviitaleaceae bacterium]